MEASLDDFVPRFELTINERNIQESVLQILRQLRPDWVNNPYSLDKLKMKVFTDGITNKLVGYYLQGHSRDTIIFKIYGEKTEDLIDREEEIQTIMLLKRLNIGAQLYGIFTNGIVYEFIPGVVLDPDTIQNPEVYNLIAAEMAKLHSVPLEKTHFNNCSGSTAGENDNTQSMVWEKLAKFLRLSKDILKSDKDLELEFKEIGISATWAASAIEELRNIVEKENMPLVFAHNDLLLGNIIYDKEISKISFIDFEYGGPNFAPFDVANHFNEFAGVDEVDYSRYPDEQLRSKWIETYLNHIKMNAYMNPASDAWNQKTFERWVTLCAPLSHLLWILWCVIQAFSSKLDFDYVNYARMRFPEYQKRMSMVRDLFGKNWN